MQDPIAHEQKRLSATCLNIIAAGLASAGVMPLLHELAAHGWPGAAGEAGVLALLCVGMSGGLHVLARRLLRSRS